MKKPDEIALWQAAFGSAAPFVARPIAKLASQLSIPYKRARYLALKWASRGLTDYGVSWRHSWLCESHCETKSTTRSYLKRIEWSSGNGQCPECYGVPASWHGHPCFLRAEDVGHRLDCALAASLKELGDAPLMMGDLTGPDYETYWNEDRLLDTRPISSTSTTFQPV